MGTATRIATGKALSLQGYGWRRQRGVAGYWVIRQAAPPEGDTARGSGRASQGVLQYMVLCFELLICVIMEVFFYNLLQLLAPGMD